MSLSSASFGNSIPVAEEINNPLPVVEGFGNPLPLAEGFSDPTSIPLAYIPINTIEELINFFPFPVPNPILVSQIKFNIFRDKGLNPAALNAVYGIDKYNFLADKIEEDDVSVAGLKGKAMRYLLTSDNQLRFAREGHASKFSRSIAAHLQMTEKDNCLVGGNSGCQLDERQEYKRIVLLTNQSSDFPSHFNQLSYAIFAFKMQGFSFAPQVLLKLFDGKHQFYNYYTVSQKLLEDWCLSVKKIVSEREEVKIEQASHKRKLSVDSTSSSDNNSSQASDDAMNDKPVSSDDKEDKDENSISSVGDLRETHLRRKLSLDSTDSGGNNSLIADSVSDGSFSSDNEAEPMRDITSSFANHVLLTPGKLLAQANMFTTPPKQKTQENTESAPIPFTLPTVDDGFSTPKRETVNSFTFLNEIQAVNASVCIEANANFMTPVKNIR